MRLYLAGKMTRPDWRTAVMGDAIYRDVRDFVRQERRWPIMEQVIFGQHDCTGPFLMEVDAENPPVPGPEAEQRTFVRDLCWEAIRASDAVYAWIHTQSAYATFAELGYAHALGKPLWVAGPRFFHELWFVYAMADYVDLEQTNPAAPLARWLAWHQGAALIQSQEAPR